jgi:hypothetical protein
MNQQTNQAINQRLFLPNNISTNLPFFIYCKSSFLRLRRGKCCRHEAHIQKSARFASGEKMVPFYAKTPCTGVFTFWRISVFQCLASCGLLEDAGTGHISVLAEETFLSIQMEKSRRSADEKNGIMERRKFTDAGPKKQTSH